MDEQAIDFEGSAMDVQQPANAQTPDTNNVVNQEDTTSLNAPTTDDVTGKDNTSNNPDEKQTNDTNDALEAGTEIEFDGNSYTVAENGDIVDAQGNVFKKADEVKAWLAENNTESAEADPNEFSIDNVRAAVGFDVLDENGQPVEFTNDPAGVANYVKAAVSSQLRNAELGAVNKLFTDIPVLKQFVDYLELNNGDPRGFGNIPDRRGIQLDQNNETQLEAVIRMAGREFNNPNINDNYIKYLKSTGALFDEAKNQLDALVQKDVTFMQQMQQEAEMRRQQEQQDLNDYWNRVAKAISNRKLGAYELPENIVKEVDGKKYTYNLNDFFNYLSRPAYQGPDGNPITAYQNDLNQLTDEEEMNRTLLDAWLTFTGGTYKDLVDMAINESNVRKLIVKSKEQRNAKTIKVNKKKSKVSYDDIIF